MTENAAYHAHVARRERTEAAEKVARDLGNWINDMACDETAFCEALMREHRTLQQKLAGVFLAAFVTWADDERGHDLRNEWTFETARKIVALLGPYGIQGPHI